MLVVSSAGSCLVSRVRTYRFLYVSVSLTSPFKQDLQGYVAYNIPIYYQLHPSLMTIRGERGLTLGIALLLDFARYVHRVDQVV